MDSKLVKFDYNIFLRSQVWLKDPYIHQMVCAADVSDSESLKWFETLESRYDYKIWGMEIDSKPIGVCGIKNIAGDTCEYFGYIGDSNNRGKGYGKLMIDSVIDKAASIGIKRIMLKVLHENIPAINLYEKTGFTEYHNDNNFKYMHLQINRI